MYHVLLYLISVYQAATVRSSSSPSAVIRALISTLTCRSMASNSTSDSECYLVVRVQVRVLLLP